LLSKIKTFVININLFKDPGKQSDHDLRNQRISSHLFVILMVITLSVLVLFTSLSIITETVTIKQPTINVYIELQTKYSQTLVCPCTQIEVDYEQFISFHPTFHQICTSDFITTQWMAYIHSNVSEIDYAFDFRYMGSTYSSSILQFCNSSPETINASLLVFNSTKYVTKNVKETDLFRSETEQIVNLFKQTTANAYSLGLSIGREMVFGNALFSGLLTNYGYVDFGDNSVNLGFFPYIYTTDDITSCSCKLDPSTCGVPCGIYNELPIEAKLLFPIPGLWIGCYMIESLFQSTLECFFNQLCLDKIYELIASKSSYPFNATAMFYNSSNTQYQITTKIDEIIENLMIEQWNDQISFNSYYEQCNPSVCIYTYSKQGDMAYMITTTIGLIGGLTTILRILIPLIVAFIRRKKRPKPIETEINGK